MHSVSSIQMMDGLGSDHSSAGMNCEQKMLKQQIFSLVRKLDGGEITATAFHDRLFTMGFEIPPAVLQLLKNYDSSGKLNFKQFVKAFDQYFQSRSEESTADTSSLAKIKADFRAALLSKGASSVVLLATIFQEVDKDGSKHLSFSEFKRGVHDAGLKLDPQNVRLLFNSYDKNGDGQLSYSEFLKALRGDLPPARLRLIRQAFQVLDKTGTQTIDLEDVRHQYDPSCHPDVKSGKITPDEALALFLDAFDCHDHDGHVTYEEFLDYYSNISTSVEDDKTFDKMLRTEWNLLDMPPPPPAFSRKGGKLVNKPIAGQTHGDIINWNQQPSNLEMRERLRQEQKNKGRRTYNAVDAHGANKINVTSWVSSKEEANEALRREFANAMGVKTRSNKYQQNQIQLGSWDEFKRSSSPQSVRQVAAEEKIPVRGGRSRVGSSNKAVYGRPSPFGVDVEQPAAEREQQPAPTGKRIQTLAEMMENKGRTTARIQTLGEMMGR